MLQMLLSVGSSKKPRTLTLQSARHASSLRLRFYCLRTALKHEKYHSLDVVLSVRIRMLGATLILESTELFVDESLNAAFDLALADEDEYTSPLESQPVGTVAIPTAAPATPRAYVAPDAAQASQEELDNEALMQLLDADALAITAPPVPAQRVTIASLDAKAKAMQIPDELMLHFAPRSK
jgi:hypothetical protein